MFVKERNKIPLPSADVKVRIALVYPNAYEMGMSSYTIHLLYSLFNNYPGIRCERFFLPKKKEKHTILQSLDSGSKLTDFDVIAFSVHYELDYMNILWILENLHLPFRTKARRLKNHPLIIAGGSAVKSNPLILLPFIDVLVFGDLEPIFEEFCKVLVKIGDRYEKFDQAISDNSDELTDFCSIPNVIVSSFALNSLEDSSTSGCVFPVKHKVLSLLDESSNPTRQILPVFQDPDLSLAFGETFLLEVNRGCPSGCRFCLTGYVNRPFRNRSFDQIKHIIDESILNTGAKKITLIGSAVASHPKFFEICQYIVDKNLQVMIPSIRIDLITPKILNVLKLGGVKSLTIAPETGTEVLRRKLNKNICNSEIIEKCEMIFNFGFQSIKFYFLVGLPFETQEDIQGITELIQNIQSRSGKNIPKKGIRLSINPFIPKFFTPYRDYTHNFINQKMEYFRNTEKFLKSEFTHSPQIEVEFLNWKEARLQTILSQLDETFAPYVEEFYENGALPVAMNRIDKENDNVISDYLIQLSESFLKNVSNSTLKLQKLINFGFIENYLLNEAILGQKEKITGCTDGCNRCGMC
ncbi:MAG: radical SAM protein [Promethearchaeota archaeon]|nr:MAG: radical SAM protein [Candidatus Lokiarchaeota archaeon]